MIDFLEERDPDSVNDDGEIKIPLTNEDLIYQFFVGLCEPAQRLHAKGAIEVDNSVEPMSASTIKGYRSALVDVHKKRHASFRKEFDAKLKDLLDGYDKIINDLKQKSLVKIREGKTFLKSNGYSMFAFKFMTLIPTRLNEAWSQVTFA